MLNDYIQPTLEYILNNNTFLILENNQTIRIRDVSQCSFEETVKNATEKTIKYKESCDFASSCR